MEVLKLASLRIDPVAFRYFPILVDFSLSYGVHLCFANIFVGVKYNRCKSLVITNKLSAVMLHPYKMGMLPSYGTQQDSGCALPSCFSHLG
jgi:hypothetical protein